MAAPAFRSRSAVSYGAGTSLPTAAWPSGLVAGDLVLGLNGFTGDVSTRLAVPTNWSRIDIDFESAQGSTTYSLDSVVWNGSDGPPTWTWADRASLSRANQLAAFMNAASIHGYAQAAATSAAPSVTGPVTDTADTLVLWIVWQFSTTIRTLPAGFSPILDDINGVGCYVAGAVFPTPGATGTLTGALASSQRHLVSTLAIRPVVTPVSAPPIIPGRAHRGLTMRPRRS